MKVAVLLGGTSAERDVSIVTGIAVAQAAAGMGYAVEAIDCAHGARTVDFADKQLSGIIKPLPPGARTKFQDLNVNLFDTVQYLKHHDFDVVFNALHGGYGEDGKLSAVLELAGIRYTGSDAISSAMGMDKHLAKTLFEAYDIPVALWEVFDREEQYEFEDVAHLGLPLVIKPNSEGSTVGLSIINDPDEFRDAMSTAFRHGNRVMAERYIDGRELTVAVLGDKPLPVVEIVVTSGIYDYEAKYQGGRSEYLAPAPIEPKMVDELHNMAMLAYHALGCSNYARVDFRMDANNELYCLEVNTLPGMTPTSLVPMAANAAGIDFPNLIDRILKLAVEK